MMVSLYTIVGAIVTGLPFGFFLRRYTKYVVPGAIAACLVLACLMMAGIDFLSPIVSIYTVPVSPAEGLAGTLVFAVSTLAAYALIEKTKKPKDVE